MIAKQDSGCRFFVTQSVNDAASTRSLLSDYALSLQACGRSPAPVVLTFSPCGSVRTLEFMKWLGISSPRWLERAGPFCRHAGALYQPVRERIHRRAGLRAREAVANRHQRRERLHSKVGDRRVSGTLSAIELASRVKATVRTDRSVSGKSAARSDRGCWPRSWACGLRRRRSRCAARRAP